MASEGETLDGTYRLHRLVGEGGMGAVYEATHARLAGRYAIKVLLREVSDIEGVRARFEEEARITSLLQHPNVVQVVDHNTTADGTSYLAMEYLSGESLAARLAREGRLPVVRVVDIVDQLAAGLAAAHARGIVHRDLKPDNIFLVPIEGRATELIKILDFGISKVSSKRYATEREICGTPQYMAPEQIAGRVADVDAMSDQYALAVITLELLTGTNPFAADSLEAVFARVRDVIVLETGLSKAVDAVLTRALSKVKARRFPSVTAFAEALRAAAPAATEPIADLLPAAPAPRVRRGGRAWRRGFAAAAAVAVTSFVGAGVANRGPLRSPVESPQPAAGMTSAARAETNVATKEAFTRPPAARAILVESLAPLAAPPPRPVASRVARPSARRSRAAHPTRDERARKESPPGPVEAPSPPPPPTLGPDEDATLPPSDS